MSASSCVPQVCLVVKWPAAVNAAIAQQIQRRLVDAHLRATWSVEEADQLHSLRTPGVRLDDVALLHLDSRPISRTAEERSRGDVSQRLMKLCQGDIAIDALHVANHSASSNRERWLRGLGLRTIISDAESPAVVRPLPFGMWQLSPLATAPDARRWLRWLVANPAKGLLGHADSAVRPAIIDLSRLMTSGARTRRSLEYFIADIAAAHRSGAVACVSASVAVEQLASVAAARPQRSILRAAA